MGDKLINVVQDGKTYAIPESQLEDAQRQGFHVEGDEEATARVQGDVNQDRFGGIGGKVVAGTLGIARGATLGLSDVALRAAGVDASELSTIRDVNPITSTVTEIGGGLIGGSPAGLASKLGARAAKTAEGASTATHLARAAKGGAAEGFVQGTGAGVSELALSDDLTLERIASTLGSNVLLGGVTGGVAGVAAKGLERGLVRAKAALDDVASRPLGSLGDDMAPDLAALDRKGLRLAEKAELDAIEAARVPKRAELADELKAFRKELKDQKVWLASKGVDDAEVKASAIGKRTLKADKALDNLLDDPKLLAENPRAALSSLRKQEAALDDLVNKHGPKLRAIADEGGGTRTAALDAAEKGLERNRALQAKIADLSSKPASTRLQQIADATEALSAPKPQAGIGGSLGDAATGYALGELSGVPGLGALVAGARFAGPLLKKMKLGSAEAAARGSKAVGAFLDVTRKVAPSAPVLATKVLGAVRYGQERQERRKSKAAAQAAPAKAPSLVQSFKARSAEIRAAVEPAMDGSGAVFARPHVRQQIAKQLAPLAAADPLLADRLETIAARRLEFLASKLPRRPDAFGAAVGPDKWQPSDMEMRTWARYVAAVEDPHGVVERLADGSVTPEDAETMRTVYPEMYADIQQQILQQLPTLRATLPYQRRLAFSVFSGVPVDPALDPQVLSRLQASFAMEEGTEQGTQAPRAQPAFGSVTKPEPTPAQQRG